MTASDSTMNRTGHEKAHDVTAPEGKAAQTKATILEAARHLFAQHGIASVSIRDIADAAGVSHGLVQRYFGTREQMIAEIIRQEIDSFAMMPPPLPPHPTASVDQGAQFRDWLRSGLDHFRDYATLIVRAELAGIRPETMIDPAPPPPPPSSPTRSQPSKPTHLPTRTSTPESSVPTSTPPCSPSARWPRGS